MSFLFILTDFSVASFFFGYKRGAMLQWHKGILVGLSKKKEMGEFVERFLSFFGRSCIWGLRRETATLTDGRRPERGWTHQTEYMANGTRSHTLTRSHKRTNKHTLSHSHVYLNHFPLSVKHPRGVWFWVNECTPFLYIILAGR